MKYLLLLSALFLGCKSDLNNERTNSLITESTISNDTIVPLFYERSLTKLQNIGEANSVARPINLNIEFDNAKKLRISELKALLESEQINKKEYLDYITNKNTYFLKWPNEKIFDFINNNSKDLRSDYQTTLCIEKNVCMEIWVENSDNSNLLTMNLSLSNNTNSKLALNEVIIRLNLTPYYIIANYGFEKFKTKFCEANSTISNKIFIPSDLLFKNQIIPHIHNDILSNPSDLIEPELVNFKFEPAS